MREEIEAAALFITRLVNKNLSQSGVSTACSSASSTHSSSSSSSSSSSESPPGFDEQTTAATTSINVTGDASNDLDKVEKFRQCLTKALFERFHNHWFPEQPTKGQAYRCIRLNEWDRHDVTLQKACAQCGIDYKDLQLPVELTLWVDPDEVTCRFGEIKGSHCSVAKFKDGELKDNDFNIDINNIDIEIFRQTTTERMRQSSLQGSPDYNKQLNQHNLNNNNSNFNSSYHFLNNNNNNNNHNQHHHHNQQAQNLSSPHQQHHQRSSLAKTAIIPSYHQNYLNGCDNNGNPIYYYF